MSTGEAITKLSKVAPVVGVVGDAASLAMNTAGAVQAFQDDSYLLGAMYTVGGVLDAASIVVEFFPGLGTLVGLALSGLSLAVGAVTDFMAGKTVGHSLTPEGAKAQQLFAQNLYGSITNRPITSVATILTTVGIPSALNAMSRSKNKIIGSVGSAFVHNVWGNSFRSAVTMAATQGINALTTKLEDSWIPPEEAEDVNFVSAFSVVGDLNDNLFGATARKATLLGLAKGDPHAQTDALARAWGMSDEDIYYNPTFDDIRQAAGINLGSFGNSIAGIIGEIFIDPQNKIETQERVLKEHVAKVGTNKSVSALSLARAQAFSGAIDPNSKAASVLYQKTDTGEFLKDVVYDTVKKRYVTEYYIDIKNPNRFETIQVYKNQDGKYINFKTGEEIISTSLSSIYDNLNFSTTIFGSFSKQTSKTYMHQYINAYLEDGIEGVRRKNVEIKTADLKHSRYVAETKADILFVENLTKFIEEQLKVATPMEAAQLEAVKQSVSDPKANTEKFKQLYKYYGIEQGDTASLIFKLQQDFNLQINTDQFHKLYMLSKSFSEKMDLISMATGNINKIVNPLGWIGPESIKMLRDLFLTTRNVTKDKYSAERIITSKRAIEKNKYNVTQDELKQARENLEQQTKESIQTAIQNGVIEAGDKDFNKHKRLANKLEKIEKDEEAYKKDLEEYRASQSLRVYHKNYNDTYIDVNESNLKDLENEYMKLKNKSTHNTSERSRLKLLGAAITKYNEFRYCLVDIKIEALAKVAAITNTLNHMLVQASEISNNLIALFNKFDTLLRIGDSKDIEKELDTIEALLERLGLKDNPDFKLVEHSDLAVHMSYSIDLAEYICSLFNRAIREKLGENPEELEIIEVHKIRQVLKGMNFKKWFEVPEGKTPEEIFARNLGKLKEIALNLCESSGIKNKRAFLYIEEGICAGIANAINSLREKEPEVLKTNKLIQTKSLVEMDEGFYKRVIINALMKNNNAFKSYVKIFEGQLNNINDFLRDLRVPDEERSNYYDSYVTALEIFKDSLDNQVTKHIKTHPMYNILQEYIYTNVKESYTFMESIYDSDIYKTLDKEHLEALKNEKDLSKITEAQVALAETKAAKVVFDYYNHKNKEEELIEGHTILEEETVEVLPEEPLQVHPTIINPENKNTLTDKDRDDINKGFKIDTHRSTYDNEFSDAIRKPNPDILGILQKWYSEKEVQEYAANIQKMHKAIESYNNDPINTNKTAQEKINNIADILKTIVPEKFVEGWLKNQANEILEHPYYLYVKTLYEIAILTKYNEINDVQNTQINKYEQAYTNMSDLKLVPFENGEYVVYEAERAFALVELPTGERLPFYRSSGNNPKPGVIVGQWYPFFGIYKGAGTDSWIMKRSSKEMAEYYGSNALKETCEYLDYLFSGKSIPAALQVTKQGTPVITKSSPVNDNKIKTAHKELKNSVESKYKISQLDDNQTIKSHYDLLGDEEEAICKLGVGIDGVVDVKHGYIEFTLKPTTFIDEQNKIYYFSQLFDPIKYKGKTINSVHKLNYYTPLVKKYIEQIKDAVKQGLCSVVYKGIVYNKNNIDKIQTETLVDVYINATDKTQGLIIRCNTKSADTFKDAVVYKKIMQREILKTIGINTENGALKLSDTETLVIPAEHSKTSASILKYILNNLSSLNNEALKNFLHNTYDKAKHYAEKNLVYAKDLDINKELFIPMVNDLLKFETKSIQSRYTSTPVVAVDYIKRIVSNDEDVTKVFKDIISGSVYGESTLGSMINAFMDSIIEARKNATKININSFDSISRNGNDFVLVGHGPKGNTFTISLIDLLIEHTVSRAQLDQLLNKVLSKGQGEYNAEYYNEINTIYTNIMNIINPSSKEDFINMIQTKHTITDEEASEVYDILYNNPQALDVVSNLRYTTKRTENKSFKEKYPDEVVDLYLKFLKDKKLAKNVSSELINSPKKKFLLYVLYWKPSNDKDLKVKEYLLSEIFFSDFKTSKGIFSDTKEKDIIKYKEQIEEVLENSKKLPVSKRNYLKLKVKEHEGTLAFIRKYKDKIVATSKEEWVKSLLNMDKRPSDQEVIDVFTNVVKLSDTSKYVPVITQSGTIIHVPKSTSGILIKEVEGAGWQNTYIITRFSDLLETDGIPTEPVVSKDGTTVLLVTDNLTNTEIVERKKELKENNKVQHVSIITSKQYEEIKNIYNNLDKEGINTKEIYIDKTKTGEPWELKKVEDRINVESYIVIVDQYLHDLDLIVNYGNNPPKKLSHMFSRADLYEFAETYYEYPMLQTGYMADATLKHSKLFKSIQEDAKISLLFKEFIEPFKTADGEYLIQLEVLGSYFTDGYIKEGKAITKDAQWKSLEDKKINGVSASEIITKQIQKLHEQHKTEPFTTAFDYNRAYGTRLMNNISTLKRIVTHYIYKGKEAVADNIILTKAFNNLRKREEYEQRVREQHIRDDQAYNEYIYNEFAEGVNKAKDVYNNLSKHYENNKQDITNEYVARNNSKLIDLDRKAKKKFNYKTMYSIINLLSAKNTKFIKSITDKGVVEFINNDTVKLLLDTPAVKDLIKTLHNSEYTLEYINKIIKDEIVYPFIQNISLDFYKEDMYGPLFFISEKLEAMMGDPRYESFRDDYLFFKYEPLMRYNGRLTLDVIKKEFNPMYIDLLTTTVVSKFKKLETSVSKLPVKEANRVLLRTLDEMLLKSPKFKEDTKAHMFEDAYYNKRRNYIEDSDFNKYNYKENTKLKREAFIVMDEGYSKTDQKNVITIAKHISNKYKDTQLETSVDNALHAIADNLCDIAPKTVEKNNDIEKLESKANDLKVFNTNDLEEYMIDKITDKLFSTYAFSKDTNLIRAIRSALELHRTMYYAYSNPDAFANKEEVYSKAIEKYKGNLSDRDAEERYRIILRITQEIAHEYNDIYLYLRNINKQTVKSKFKNNGHFVQSINTNVFNDNIDFYNFLSSKLELPNKLKGTILNEFNSAKTLTEFYRNIYTYIDDSNKHLFYALIITINHFKELHYIELSKSDRSKDYTALDTMQIGHRLNKLQNLKDVYGLGLDYSTNIFEELKRPVVTYENMTSSVKTINSKLARVIGDRNAYVKSIEPDIIVNQEKGFTTVVKQMQRESTRALFKTDQGEISTTTSIRIKIEQTLNLGYSELVREVSAKNVNELGTEDNENVYNSIRRYFTKVAHLCGINKNGFIRIGQICNALEIIRALPELGTFYIKQFDLIKNDFTEEKNKEINNAIKELRKFFGNRNGYLTNMNDNTIKAIIGLIYYTEYDTRPVNIKNTEVNEAIADIMTKNSDVAYKLSKSKHNEIKNIINSNDDRNTKLDKITKIIYPKGVDVNSDKYKRVIQILDLTYNSHIKSLMNGTNLHDTFEHIDEESVGLAWEDYKIRSKYINLKRDKITEIQKRIKFLEKEINKHKKIIIHTAENDKLEKETITLDSITTVKQLITDLRDVNEILQTKTNAIDTDIQEKVDAFNEALDIFISEFLNTKTGKAYVDRYNNARNAYFNKVIEVNIKDRTKLIKRLKDAHVYKTGEKFFTEDIIDAYCVAKYNSLKAGYTDEDGDIAFTKWQEIKKNLPSSVTKDCDKLAKVIANIYKNEQHRDKYINISPDDIDLQKQYAHDVFTDFKRTLYESRDSESEKLKKEFLDNLNDFKNSVNIKESIFKKNSKNYETKIDRHLTYVHTAIKDIAKTYDLNIPDLNKDNIEQALDIIKTKLEEFKNLSNEYYKKHSELKKDILSNEAYTKSKISITIDQAQSCINKKYHGDYTRHEDLLDHIFTLAFKSGKDITSYLKNKNDIYYQVILCKYEEFKGNYYFGKYTGIQNKYNATNEHYKDYLKYSKYKTNLDQMNADSDAYYETLRSEVEQTIGIELEDLYTGELKHRFMFNAHNEPGIINNKFTKSSYDKAIENNLEQLAILENIVEYDKELNIGDKAKEEKSLRDILKDLEETAIKYEGQLREAYDKLSKITTNMSNSKLYRRYSTEISNRQIKEDAFSIVDDVKNRVVEDGLFTKEQLDKLIKDNGEDGLHNPVIDVLITMYNYLYQMNAIDPNGKFTDKHFKENRFIIMDMETVQDITEEHVPYQITVLEVQIKKDKDGNVSLVPTVSTMYFNSYVFFDSDIKNPDFYLQNFIDQQRDMYSKDEPDITEEEVLNRVENIIKRTSGVSNTLEKGMASITLLNNRTCHIVAHNGKRFDFTNYDEFISNYARKLLQNEVFKEQYANVKTIREGLVQKAIDSLDLDEATYKEVQKELKELIRMYEDDQISTELDLAKYSTITKQLLDYMNKYITKKHINEVVVKLNEQRAQKNLPLINLNNERYQMLVDGKDSVFNKIIDYCYDYIVQADTLDIDTYIDNLKDLDITLDKNVFKQLLTYVIKDLQSTNSNEATYKTMTQAITDNIMELYKLPKNIFDKFDNTQRIAIIEKHISEIAGLIGHIKTLETGQHKDISAYVEFNKILEETKNKINSMETDINTYKERVTELEKKIKNFEDKNNELYTKLYTIFTQIRDYTMTSLSRAHTALTNRFDTVLEQSTGVTFTDNTLLQENLDIAKKEIQDIYNVLEAFINALNNKDVTDKLPDIENTLLNIRVQNYINSKSKEDVKNSITKRLEEIRIYKDNDTFSSVKLEMEWEIAWDYVKSTAMKNVETLVEYVQRTIDYLLTEVPKPIKEVLEKSLKNGGFNETKVEGLRDALNMLSLTNDEVNLYMKSNNNIQKLTTALSKNSELNRNIALTNVPTKPELTRDNLDLITLLLEKEESTLANSLLLINAMDIKSNKFTYSNIDDYLSVLLKRVGTLNLTLEDIQIRIVEDAALRPKYGSIIDPEKDSPEKIKEIRTQAAKILPKDDPKYSIYNGIERWYVDLNEGNDIKAVTEKFNVTFRSEDEYGISISFNTERHHVLQTLYIPKDKNGQLKDVKDWEYRLQYCYNTKGKGFEKAKIEPRNFNVTDKIKFYEDGKDDKNVKRICPYKVTTLEIDNKDYSKEAIENLFKFTDKLKDSKNKAQYIIDNTVDIRDCSTEHLTTVNLHDLVREKFRQQLQLLNSIQNGKNIIAHSVLYKAIYKQVMGNLNAVKPGMYILQIPKEHESNIIQKMSAKGEDELKIDLFKVSEANMGNALTAKTVYTTTALFGANTSPVRTILATNILHSKFTPIIINNDMFSRGGDDVHSHYERFIYKVDTSNKEIDNFIKGKSNTLNVPESLKEFDKWVDAKIDKEIDKDAPDKYTEDWRTERKRQLYNIESMRYKFLKTEREYTTGVDNRIECEYINGIENRSIFVPRVGPKDVIDAYRDDVYHPIGLNLTVACTSDERAYEDVILVDSKYAYALGTYEGNKLWLKYGFKGAIKVEDGIEDMYGAAIITVTSSVEARGSKGMYLEMFGNKLIDYCTLKKDTDKIKILGKDTFDIFEQCKAIQILKNKYMFKSDEDFNKWRMEGNSIPRMYIIGDSLIFNDTDYKDSETFLNYLINNTCDLFGNKNDSLLYVDGIYTTANLKYDYKDVLKAKAKIGASYKVLNSSTNKYVTKNYDATNNNIFRGTLYVALDPEHQAAHMQSKLQLQLTEDKGLTYTVKDAHGNVRKGGQQSFTVEQSYAQKIGYDFAKYIVDATDDTSLKAQYKATWDIMLYGMEIFDDKIIKNKDGFISIDATVENILNHTQLSSSMKTLFRDYYNTEKYLQNHRDDYDMNIRKQEIEKAIKDKVLHGWGGNRGIGYNANYKKYNAARAQILADIRLKTGESKFPASSWDTLYQTGETQIEINGKLVPTNKWAKDEKITKDKVNKLLQKYSNTYDSNPNTFYTLDNLDTEGNVQVPTNYEGTKSEYLVELYKRLRFLGILKGYKAEDRTTILVQDSEVTSYISNIKVDVNKLKQTTAYVMGVRYPVQDINATPVLKITGIVEHSAVVCNTAIYPIMGADNDGDAASFSMIKFDEVKTFDPIKNKWVSNEKSDIKYLNASRKDFYDNGYLENIASGDMHINDDGTTGYIPDSFNSVNPLVGPKAAYIGKKTAPVSSYVIRNGVADNKVYDEKGNIVKNKDGSDKLRKKSVVRAGDNHYTYTELLSYNSELLKNLKDTVRELKNLPISFTGCESNDMFWINSHIWVNNKGRNVVDGVPKNFYESPEKINEYYKAHLNEIEELKKIEWWLNNTRDGHRFIEEHLEDIIKHANYVTLSRGRVSKLNVGVTGGYRKGVYLGTTLSIFPNINRDKTGHIWHTEYGVTETEDKKGVEPFSVYSIFDELFKHNKDELDKKSIQEIKALCKNKDERMKYVADHRKNALDIDRVSAVVLEHYLEMRIADKCLKPLFTFFTKDNATFGDLLKATDEDLILEPMTYVVKYANIHKDEIVNPSIMQLVKEYYFSRFIPDFNKVVKEYKNEDDMIQKLIDHYKQGLEEELFLTRALSKVLDGLIQEPISYSKHGSAIADYTEIDEELRTNAQKVSESLIKKKIFVGDSYNHSRAIAMGAEYNTKERAITFKLADDISEAKTKRSSDYINAMPFKQGKITENDIDKRINLIIKNDMCGVFIDDDNLTKTIEAFKTFGNFIVQCIEPDRSFKFTDIPDDVIIAIKQFENLNISLYKVIKCVNIIADICRHAKSVDKAVSLPGWVPNLAAVKCLQGLDKQKYRSIVNAASEDNLKYFINYITEVDNPIDEEATGTVEYEYSNLYSSEDLYQAMEEAAEVTDDALINVAYPTTTDAEVLTDQYVNMLGIPQSKYIVSPTELITNWVSQIQLLLEQCKQDRQELKHSTKTVGAIRQSIINKEIGYGNLKPKSIEATETYSDIADNKKAIEEYNKEIKQLEQLKIELERHKQNLEANQKGLKDITPEETLEKLQTLITKYEQEKVESTKQNIKYSLLGNMKDLDTLLLNNVNNNSNLKVLQISDIQTFQDSLLLNMDMYQHPFQILVHSWTYTTADGKVEPDWDRLYKYLVQNHSYIRITEVVKAKETEGLAKRLINYITLYDTNMYKNKKGEDKEWGALTKLEKLKRINKTKRKGLPKLETFEDLKKLTKDAIFTFNKESYKIDTDVYDPEKFDFITPTLKEIKITSPKQLKDLWYKGILENKLAIGFTYINDLISATEDAYKPYIVDGKGARLFRATLSIQKALMRYSSGFLLRNAMDTFNQLLSDMYLEKGLGYMAMHPRQLLKYLQYGTNVYSMYSKLSEERLFTLSEVKLLYMNIDKSNDPEVINTLGKRLYRYLKSYIDQSDAMETHTKRIKERTKHAKEIANTYNNMLSKGYINKQVCYQMYQFLGSIKFAEYYEFYDNKEVDGKIIYGLRIDAHTQSRKNAKKIRKKLSKQDEVFKSLLIKYSAFNQTNAQIDLFKEQQYKELGILVRRTELDMFNKTEDETINSIEVEIDTLRKQSERRLKRLLDKTTVYEELTEYTENIARIMGFILHEDLYGYSYDMTVQKSLQSWFNYGQRSPLETQLMFDIPYISFPLRSINNWRRRLLDPRYARLMDDIIDGVYSQYADEDGQYDEYTQFMIKNGWIPITKKLGIRAGSGAFDIMNLITDTPENINARRNPILRGLKKFIESGDLAQAAQQLSTVGILNRAAQQATLGSYDKKQGKLTQPKLARTSSMFFEYNKYTPKKYNYLYNNNGRAKYYENIYRDWFNKYGRMRKPTQDPVQLVKNIQWKQFLKRMQNKYRK